MGSTETAVREHAGKLTIFYDERCELCRRCRDWLLTQPCHIEVELLPAGAPEVRRRYAAVPWLGQELVVLDDSGNVWMGPAAYLVCMWATVRYRSWSYRLARPLFAPVAARFFRLVSSRRDRVGAWLSRRDTDCSWCDRDRITFGPP